MLNNLYREATEPAISCVTTNQVTQILDAKYERANLPKVVENNCGHLNVHDIGICRPDHSSYRRKARPRASACHSHEGVSTYIDLSLIR